MAASRALLLAVASLAVVPVTSFLGGGMRLSALHPVNQGRLSRSFCTTLRAEQKTEVWRGPGNPNKQVEVYKPNFADDLVNDLTDKKFGNGWAFYGERETLKEKDYEALGEQAEEMARQRFIKKDPALIIGASTPFGQWIALEAMKRDVNVRILASDFDQAEFLFGTDGSNADIYFGSASNLDQLDNALDGAQSIIYADEGSLPFGPTSFQSRLEDGLKKTLEVAKRYPSIRRVILVTSQTGGPFAGTAQPHKDAAEQALRASGLPYVILRPAKLSAEFGEPKEISVTSDATQSNGASVRPMDLAQVAATILLMDEVAAKAEKRAAEAGQAVPNLPRVKPGLTLHVANGPATEEEDQFTALVKAIATQPAD